MRKNYVVAAAVVLLLGVALFAGLMGPSADAAPLDAPLAAPTPVSALSRSQVPANDVVLFATTSITEDTNGPAVNIQAFSAADIQHVVDVTAINTTTLTLQFSNDGVNWVDGPAIASAVVADANVMQQYAVFGKFARINANVSDTDPITVSVYGVAK